MKALILAAGLGTRLRPYTDFRPKPLFPLEGRPVLEGAIRLLESAGAEAIIINTHHLHDQIEEFLAGRSYGIPVTTRFEPQLLGTAGAIRNVADFWDDRPFIVINSDIVTDIDLQEVYAYHLSHSNDITLVMHDYAQFNHVTVDAHHHVVAFGTTSPEKRLQNHPKLAFTGIHVLEPKVLQAIPATGFADIIAVYNRYLAAGRKISAYVAANHYWCDIGTPEGYRQAVFDRLAPQAFHAAALPQVALPVEICKLAGDGSDRTWYRLGSPGRSIIMVDHGLRDLVSGVTEAEAFVALGHHLKASGVPVPDIYGAETFCGLAFIEDLGDTHLQSLVTACEDPRDAVVWYRKAIDMLITMSLRGRQHFDPAWTYQTPRYDKDLIIAKECRYFVDAFLNGYRGLNIDAAHLMEEFSDLAQRTEQLALPGFMHRDFQSRNIMVKNGQLYIIDFQGARIGPLQYDLASLLLDPYVALPYDVQDELKDYCLARLSRQVMCDARLFNEGYHCCRLTRNLQILGAFGFLSRRKNKHYFEQYIPVALKTLHRNLSAFDPRAFPQLKSIVEALL